MIKTMNNSIPLFSRNKILMERCKILIVLIWQIENNLQNTSF